MAVMKMGLEQRKARRRTPAERPRTQGERSADMKQRLIDATLGTLHDEGYVALTIGRVVERAGVSRGAPLHHFASKAALVAAAAEALIATLSVRMERQWLEAREQADPLRAFCLALWHDVFLAPEGVMLAELSQASRRAPELAESMSGLWTNAYRVIIDVGSAGPADAHPTTEAAERPAGRILMLSQWLMRGMAADAHLGASEALFESYLDEWIKAVRLSGR